MHPKDADGVANSVDPDQAAPLGLGSYSIKLIKWPYFPAFSFIIIMVNERKGSVKTIILASCM